jgi:predicted phage terminase large subunit-like protein
MFQAVRMEVGVTIAGSGHTMEGAGFNRGDRYYVLEVLRGKFPFDKLKDKIIDMKQRYGRAQLVIEESPISHGLIQSLSEKHINVVAIKPDRDKRSRLISQIDLFEGGSVLLPTDAPWLEAFVAELLSFPGRHDDQVDALTQGLAWRREAWREPIVQRTTYGTGGWVPPPTDPGSTSK